jgi:four helix bundle protein
LANGEWRFEVSKLFLINQQLMKGNLMNAQQLVKRTTNFAIACANLAADLPDTKIGSHIRHQLFRCSSSVAANYRASRLAQSTAGFIAKLSIVIEEADESEFWIDFAIRLNLLTDEQADPIKQEANELASIFIASRKTLLKKQTQPKLT